ncbi:MAG TPA: hypothetical protein VJY84_00370 [Candidatus Saccharimonadales bacterium]|nr:hypothetical protein [Candidatus Saccharimonadales bacterium]HLB66753.1 hypothetical protein [Candidatus Saccharimonadales bacterium]
MAETINHDSPVDRNEAERPFLDDQDERAWMLGSYQAARDELPIIEQMIASGEARDRRHAWEILDEQWQTPTGPPRLSESQRHFRIKRNYQIENSE